MSDTTTSPSWIGLIGLAVMGQNLALNIARKGFSVAVYNRTAERTRVFLDDRVTDEPIVGAETLEQLVQQLATPRRLLLMVKAGQPVDALIDSLIPLLSPGDTLIDAGNSHPDDTERRAKTLEARGLRFVGMGVSGGEEGALEGPSLMPGGPKDAFDELEPMLRKIAADGDDGPCVAWLGPAAAGHFVKMVHNGIEYADMQLIAEVHDLMGSALGLSAAEQAAAFSRWNEGPLQSYLIEITATILTKNDPETGAPMVDVVLDRAGQKGTGRWTAEIALRLGVPAPTIHSAVDARGLSARLAERRVAAERLAGPDAVPVPDHRLVDDLHEALYAGKICCYAQGFGLLAAARQEQEWDLDLAEVARIWTGGCIIRAKLLTAIQRAHRRDPDMRQLLLDNDLGEAASERQAAWRRVVGLAAEYGVPALALGSSLAYFDSVRRRRLPQSLTQAQRDYFGAHTFERVDRAEGEFFHVEWDSL
ncbi:MAG: NADP-dependent phosphogluconate dehydrogenase [Planctomycetota bacterium]